MRSQKEVRAIIRELCFGLKPLFPQGPMDAILFGSYARGEADDESDIDVMVLVDSSRRDISRKTWEISSVAADLLLKRGVMVSPIVENRHYFQQHTDYLPFYKNVVQEGVRYSD
ncbi:MAG: nucleotidyltransferase domain-containing protein [Oscillospiraceae bacterium]|nr:nucleotidyltransferase domain-containing protein [Oscillospiraceae bacterium]